MEQEKAVMKGYKGFEKGLVCRGKKYAENEVFEEESAKICNSGMHFCALPHQVFEHYSPGNNNEFAEVEALDEVYTDDEIKYCTKKLKVGAKINVFDLCKISVSAFFERFGFADKIKKAKESAENNAGDRGAANAGDRGAANAGNCGAANAGDWGAANAGNCGAANAGNWGAANAGNWGAANAGDWGAANAGNWGAAVVRDFGSASVGKRGVAIAYGNNSKVKGEKNAILVIVHTDDNGNISEYKTEFVDGEKIKAEVWYELKHGEFAEVE